MNVRLRPYGDADRGGLLSAWEAAMPLEALTPAEFERRVVLDPNREPGSLELAVDSETGRIAGYCLRLVLRNPIEKVGLMEDRGFITAFGVRPEFRRNGIGSALLASAEGFFHRRERRLVTISPYTPNYFIPGVDKERSPEAFSFLRARGFEEYIEAIGMDAPIGQYVVPPEVAGAGRRLAGDGVEVVPFRREWMTDYLAFMREHMPGPWVEDARRNLLDMTRGLFPEGGILLARAAGRIIGYCQFEGEHFGPFGIVEEWQGRGVGTVLLARTLEQMRRFGHHAAYVLWTGERAAGGVYARLGFRITRRFAIMRKVLE